MQLDNSEQQAFSAARLLGQLAGKDLGSVIGQEWLCGELANIFRARSAALYWPAEADFMEEIWGLPQGIPISVNEDRVWVEACRQALRSGQVVWVEAESIPAEDSNPARLAFAPFSREGKGQGVLVLWIQATDLQAETQELLEIIGSGLAGQRDQTRQLSQSREACAELEQRRAELLHSRDTLRALFDNTTTSMYIISSDYSLLAVNRCRAELGGQKPQHLVGRSCFEALFGRRSPCQDCRVGESLVAGRDTRRITRRTYSSRPAAALEITTFPVQDASGQVGQAIIFEEDVTERRRLEASLAQAEKLAAVGQLAAGVAHEINNPLTAVIANAQLLERSFAGSQEDWIEMVTSIIQAGKRASQVVQQLLDLSRPNGTGPLLTDVNETLCQAFSILQPELRARAVHLEMDLADDLPVLMANPDQLQSVWLNLFVNAMDAVQNGQGEIRVSTRRCGEAVEVGVEDNGSGIPAERLAQIFEPFYSTKDPGRGTGLGLSICYRVVKEHGGEIRVESQPGAGTSFAVSLPITSPT
jgi:two-component system NtrC family sensor kinase